MKILFINAVCGIGSTGRIVSELMKRARMLGYTVRIACSTIEPVRDVNEDEIFFVGSKLDYYSHNLLSRITDHEGLFSKKATIKLLKRIKEYDPDLIHIHNIHGHWLNYELLFKYLADSKKRIIWTLHDCWTFTGHCAFFSSIGCDKWKVQCENCQGLARYPKCYGKGDVLRNQIRKKEAFLSTTKICFTTPSSWLANMVRQSFFKDYQVVAIPNGIDLSVFRPTKSRFREEKGLDGKKIVLAVANVWSERKGLSDLMQLHSLLDDSFALIIVGVTREQQDSLAKGIIGIMRTQSVKQLVEIYSSADVFVNPSYEETMGLVTAEALACGTPAVVYDQTAVPEVVDEKSGIIVEAGNIKGLYAGVCKVLSNLKMYSDGALQRSLAFDGEKQYSKYMSLYSGEENAL